MRAGVPSARSRRSARTSGVGRHSRRMSSTSPGMSIHGSVDTSCAMSPIGNSGARSSGPTGSFVAGCSGGCSGSGMTGQHVEPRGRDLVGRQVESQSSAPSASARDRRRDRAQLATSALGSSARTSASPTSTASNPAAAMRRGVVAACGSRSRRPRRRRPGIASTSRSPTARSSANVAEVARVDADDPGAERRAPARARRRRAPRRARRGRARPRGRAGRGAARRRGARPRSAGRVGADRPRLVHLDRVDGEVLAQHRQSPAPRARGLQVGDRPAEVRAGR